MNGTRIAAFLFGLGLAASAVAVQSMRDEMAVMDSLRQMPRWEQVRWLARRGLPDPYLRDLTPTEDSGLQCAGRWSYGPSTWVDVRATADDTIVFLSRGSGVSVIRFRSQDSLRLDLLSDINSHGLTGRCQVRDTLLYVNSGGVECYDVSDLSQPILLNWLSQPLIYDFFVVDTFLYTSSRDSLRIFSVAYPASPRRLGACADSGYVMYVSGNYAYLGHQAGLFILDVTNPASPRRTSMLGFDVLSLWVRDTLLCFGTYHDSTFRVYDVRNPAAPRPVGSLAGIGAACLYMPPTCDTVIYSSAFDVISLANPAAPRRVGSVSAPGWEYGVATVPALSYGLVADHFEGLVAVNISNPATPTMASQQYAADLASDICVQGDLAYVADLLAGMRILDISDPTRPATLGGTDSLFSGVRCPSVAVKDSFAFMGMYRPWFRSVNVSDPAHPTTAGACNVPTEPQDMVVRDSLVYAAINYEFDIINVARPREPVVVGTCGLPEHSREVILSDTLAYVATLAGAVVVSIARPQSPYVIGSWPRDAMGIDLRDTILYAVTYSSSTEDALLSLSVANPAAPYVLDSVIVPRTMHDVLAVDTIGYVGGWEMRFVSVADPRNLRLLGERWVPPSLYIRRLAFEPPYIYVAATDGGVCIMETLQTGVAEPVELRTPAAGISVTPSVTRRFIKVRAVGEEHPLALDVHDVMGNQVAARLSCTGRLSLVDLQNVPVGVYLVCAKTAAGTQAVKVVKTRR